jgi:uncharacterized protein (UPF0332 family)
MAKVPLMEEREFIKITQNHGEFRYKLQTLGHENAASDIRENAHHIGLCWLRLAYEHMSDAKAAVGSNCDRAAYSRSYYAIYNASKSVRYIVTGSVSLAGDDHKKAPDLPDDFPEVEKWAAEIIRLREHRLRADYDNWRSTGTEQSVSPANVIELAEQFLSQAKQYLETKFGVKL